MWCLFLFVFFVVGFFGLVLGLVFFFLGLVHYFYMQLIFMDAYVGSLWFVVLKVFLPCLLFLSVTFSTPFCMLAFCISCSSIQFPPSRLNSSFFPFLCPLK